MKNSILKLSLCIMTSICCLGAMAQTPDMTCTVDNASDANWSTGIAVWLNDFPLTTSENFILTSPGTFAQDGNGNASFTGTVVSVSDASAGFTVNINYINGTDWAGWSAQGRTYKDQPGLVNNNYLNWYYYELDNSNSTLTGFGSLNGVNLNLSHNPLNYQYGLQVGETGNLVTTGGGLSGWFFYTDANGNYAGNGDVIVSGDCNDGPMFDCPVLAANIGDACDDGNPNTSAGTIDANCDCTGGLFLDDDNDGIGNADDQCPGFDDTLLGTSCDDGDADTENDVYVDCNVCAGTLIPVFGCTDIEACNYNANANQDDGSCDFGNEACIDPCNPIEGCTDPTANNYNADACVDNGSCTFNEGCTDPTACNYDAAATVDNGSCDFGNEACIDPCNPIEGCTDPTANNYNADACVDNGSCTFNEGCTDPAACNYDATATVDNGSCDFGNLDCIDPCNPIEGCTDPTANNYNADACVDNGSCTFNEGCTDPAACNYDATATVDNGSCDFGNLDCIDPCNPIEGCTDPTANNYNADACVDNGSCTFNEGCTDPAACNYDATATVDNGSCDFGNLDCSDPCAPVMGCMDLAACNYNAGACVADGSCVYATGCDTCSGEVDGSGTVVDNPEIGESCDDGDANTINDIIGADCSCLGEIIIMGCTDITACNYDMSANMDNGSCVLVGDTCDDNDAGTENDEIQGDCTCAGTPVSTGCSPGVGLENIIVETYYVSDVNDAEDEDGGFLASGSVTYRIFVDMAAGWSLESVFGNSDHTMSFNTTTEFFNNEDRGETSGEAIGDNRLDENTVALDSWLTFGAASDAHLGVPKSYDTDGSIVGGANNDGGSEGTAGGLLVNADPAAGIPLTTADGLIASSNIPQLSFVGDITSQVNTHFADVNSAGGFIVQNGAYAVLGGASGSTADNIILIGQITTDGIMDFEISFRLGGPGGVFEQYVPSNPVVIQGTNGQMEIQCDLLSYSSDMTVVEALRPQLEMKSFPNPNDGNQLTIEIDELPGEGELVTMELIDMFGRTIPVGQFVNENQTTVLKTIDFDRQLQDGVYVVKVRYNGFSTTQKIIVSNN